MKVIKFVLVLVLISTVLSCNSQGFTKKDLKTELDSASYSLGIDIAVKLKGNFKEINQELFIQGVKNGLDSTNVLIDFEKVEPILREFFQKKQIADQEKRQAEELKKVETEFADYKLEGEKFLEQNKDAEGVITTASGLQYLVIKEGTGEKPSETSTVKVHYHGTLADGTVFDSSVDRGEPIEFNVNGVIKGWTEGLQLMPVGSKYKFFIPQELAYGAQQRGEVIKPFSVLVFEVELLEVKAAE
jgi:FKBP-type peptidyl-prolyl cis-trans isomerase FklB